MRFLVVDDDPVVRMMLRLRFEGDVIVEVTNVRDALDAIAEERPDAAVIDVTLSMGNDGIGLVREIRSWDFMPQFPIAVYTASHQDAKRVEVFAAGADEYLPKPFEPEVLRQRLARLLAMTEEERTLRRKDLVERLTRGETVDLEALDRMLEAGQSQEAPPLTAEPPRRRFFGRR